MKKLIIQLLCAEILRLQESLAVEKNEVLIQKDCAKNAFGMLESENMQLKAENKELRAYKEANTVQLTETQIQQANDLIKRYGFCSLETQKQLQENDFYSHCVVNHFLIFIDASESKNGKDDCICVLSDSKDAEFYTEKSFYYLPMPQFHEVWAVLPSKIGTYKNKQNEIIFANLTLQKGGIYYENIAGRYHLQLNKDITESACLLWLKLKKENLLRKTIKGTVCA